MISFAISTFSKYISISLLSIVTWCSVSAWKSEWTKELITISLIATIGTYGISFLWISVIFTFHRIFWLMKLITFKIRLKIFPSNLFKSIGSNLSVVGYSTALYTKGEFLPNKYYSALFKYPFFIRPNWVNNYSLVWSKFSILSRATACL